MAVNVYRKIMREIAAGIIVYRKTDEGHKFLLLYHGNGYWNFPKGKIESEEKSLQAAFREVKEETGISKKDLRLIEDFKIDEKYIFKKGKEKVFKTVIFYLAETKQANIKVSFEHSGYGWFEYREAKKMLAKYKLHQNILEQAQKCILKIK